jgi:hypothetical protein
MKPLPVACLLCFLSTVPLPAQVSVPRLGAARFDDGTVHVVNGLPANLLVSPDPFTVADHVSFSQAGGLVSHSGRIRLLDANSNVLGEFASGEPEPVLNMDSSYATAIAWLPLKHSLLYWSGDSFKLLDVPGGLPVGEITSLRILDEKRARLLLTQPDSSVLLLTVSLSTGNLLSADALPGLRGHTFSQGSFFVCQDRFGLTIESASGDRSVPLSVDPLPAGDLIIERMSADWLHITSASSGRNWALYLTATSLQVSLLPTPTPSKAQELAQ